jgi:phospholipid/cholesterol/gamma-HCH transport system substrate-binding protein
MKQIKVGLFLTIGIFILAVSIFLMGSNKSIFQKTIALHTYFDSAQGLTKGGVVSLAGVKVGNIDIIDFDETKNLVKITFLAQDEFAKKIKSDSIVEIRTQGALGDKFLYITPGKSSESVKDNTELKSEYGNDIMSVLSKRGNESEKLFDAISDFQKLMTGLTADNKIPKLISKLDQTAGNLNESSDHFKKAMADGKFEKTVARLENIIEKIDTGQGTLGALINDKSVHERLKNLLGAGQKQQQVKSILKSSVED